MAPPNKTSREAILNVAGALAEKDGLRGVAMRAIAAQLGVAPGTIYNVVGDIDEIVLLVNAQTLRRLQSALQTAIDTQRAPLDNAYAVADAYVVFVLENSKTWSMLLEHSLAPGAAAPSWFLDELERTIGIVDAALQPMLPDPADRRRSVATLWASLQGLASLAAAEKLSAVYADDPRDLARLLIGRFFAASPSPTQTKQRKAR